MSATNGKPHLAKYSLVMIVRNCAKNLDECLKTIAPLPDEIVIVNTGITEDEEGFKETNAVAQSYNAKVFHFPWIKNFSAARNFSFSKASHDVVMWLDSDDSVFGARALDRTIRENFGSGQVQCLYLKYLYDFDDRGNCQTILNRERIVDRRYYEWRAPIHETMCETFGVRALGVPSEVANIKHRRSRDDSHGEASLKRNLETLEYNFLPPPDGLGLYCEERMAYYWAQTFTGLKRYEEALRKYLEYIPRSGSQPEIQSALGNASECCIFLGRFAEAKALAHQAIDINPAAPTPYWYLAKANMESGNLKLAVHYALQCLNRGPQFEEEIVANPKVIFGGSALLAAIAMYQLGNTAKIEELLQIAEKYHGSDDKTIVEIRKNISEQSATTGLLDAFNRLRVSAESEGRPQDVKALARVAPIAIREHEDVARFVTKSRPEEKLTIQFYCAGGMAGGWGPELLETGIGGSEEAVCFMAEQFAKFGWNVEVYAACKRQTWRGVEWYNLAEFCGENEDPPVDVLVNWRFPTAMVGRGFKAKRAYLWMHDVAVKGWWVPNLIESYDGMFVLSQYHADLFNFIPNEKKILSGNGIPLDWLVPSDVLANESTRMIYASDPMRGLETVLLWWEHIRNKVPTAELDIYYGFHPTLLAAAAGKDPASRNMASAIKRIDDLRKQPGVNWLGFVGQNKLHYGMSRAGIWLYPTQFPEISCITGIKMQAHGVVPVTVNDFAMKETVRYGDKLDLKMDTVENQKVWADAVIAQALNPWSKEKRLEMATAIRATCGWDKIAAQWLSIFERDLAANKPERVYPRNRLDLMCAAR